MNRMLRSPEKLQWAVGGLIALGTALRLAQYLTNRVLWLDEARLALNIATRSAAELAQPVLDRLQAAPFLFLAVERSLVVTFGVNEYTLRAFPLIASVAALFLFWLLAKRCLSPTGALFALFLFTISSSLIYFSAEVKQYASDVAAVLLVYVMALRIHQQEATLGQALLFGGVGAVLIWFSHPLLFVLAAVGLTLFIDAAWRRTSRRLALYALIGSIWALSFGLQYLMILQDLAVDASFQEWWGEVESAFAPLPVSSSGLQWYPQAFSKLMRTPGGFFVPELALFCAFLGVLSFWYEGKRRELAFFVSPLLFALLASSLHKYPFSGRLMLFCVPTLFLLVAAGVRHLLAVPFPGRLAVAAVLCGVLAPVGGEYQLLGQAPKAKDELRPAVQYLARHWRPEDVVYLYYAAEPSFKFYWPHNGGSYITGVRSRDNWHKYIDDLNQLRGKPRVWVFFSHVFTPVKKTKEGVSEQDFFVQYLDRLGTRLDGFETTGGCLYLYDLRAIGQKGNIHEIP